MSGLQGVQSISNSSRSRGYHSELGLYGHNTAMDLAISWMLDWMLDYLCLYKDIIKKVSLYAESVVFDTVGHG